MEETYTTYREWLGMDSDARTAILEFLGWEELEERPFAQNVRIVLAAAEFSKELTTSVMWLNKQGLDIQCVRIKPYSDNGRILIDVQQIIPLPEAAEYQIRIKEKQDRDRVARESSKDYTKYDVTASGRVFQRLNKRTAALRVVKSLCESGVAPEAIARAPGWTARRLRSADGIISTWDELIAWHNEQAKAGGRSFDDTRYFCEDDELIHCDDKTWVLSNQWGTRTYELLSDLISAFPDRGVKCTPSST